MRYKIKYKTRKIFSHIDSSLIYFSFADYIMRHKVKCKTRKIIKINKISHTNIWHKTQIELKMENIQ